MTGPSPGSRRYTSGRTSGTPRPANRRRGALHPCQGLPLAQVRPLALAVLFLLGPGVALPVRAAASAPSAAAAADLPQLCDAAAGHAARATGVPLAVLRAISLTETGRRRGGTIRPWPWTVNMEGEGHWFPTREAALAYVGKRHAAGARSFDLGCFQLNHRWHGNAFASFDAMFDPEANALYAARFLRSLYDEFGDWTRAAGAYHSRTPEPARRYSARFGQYLAALTGAAAPATAPQRAAPPPPQAVAAAPDTPQRPPVAPRPNRYPLLQAGQSAGLGSLVPQHDGGPALFAAGRPQG